MIHADITSTADNPAAFNQFSRILHLIASIWNHAWALWARLNFVLMNDKYYTWKIKIFTSIKKNHRILSDVNPCPSIDPLNYSRLSSLSFSPALSNCIYLHTYIYIFFDVRHPSYLAIHSTCHCFSNKDTQIQKCINGQLDKIFEIKIRVVLKP